MQERDGGGAATLADALADTSERGSVSAGCGGQQTLNFVQMWMAGCALAVESGVATHRSPLFVSKGSMRGVLKSQFATRSGPKSR